MRGLKRRNVRSTHTFHDKSANLALFYRMDILVFSPDGRKLYSSRNRSDFRNPPISRNPSHLPRQTRVVANLRITVEGPFGEVVKKTGVAAACPFGFSTKHQDDETGIVMYPYRPYNPSSGRWLSRDPIEEQGGVNLYGFLANDGRNKIDPDGLAPKLSYKTISGPTPSDRGGFKWVIQWLLDADSPKGGWVMQHVTVTADIHDCTGKKIPLPNASWWPLWEAWKINKGKKVTTYAETGDFEDDTYELPSSGGCTKGTITVEGSSDFYENLALPPVFKVTNKPPAGILPETQTDPKLTGGSGGISHTLTATWNCCDGKDKKTTITTK